MDDKYFGRVARCHQYCEEIVSRICMKLSEKAEDLILRNIARIIGQDSKKHALIMSDIASLYGVEEFDLQDCSRYSGAAYGLIGYLKEIESKLESISSDKEIYETLESVVDMVASIGMTDRTLVTDGLSNDLKSYFMELMIQVEDDEFRHMSLLKKYIKV